MKDYEKEMYAGLGLLSVKFASMEYKLSEILLRLINSDSDIVTQSLIERNSIEKNMQHLVRINEIRDFQSEDIKEMLKKIGKIKKVRNELVHGLWKTPQIINNKIEVVCESRLIKYPNKKAVDYPKRKRWELNGFKSYTLPDIEQLIEESQKIILKQEELLDFIEENDPINL